MPSPNAAPTARPWTLVVLVGLLGVEAAALAAGAVLGLVALVSSDHRGVVGFLALCAAGMAAALVACARSLWRAGARADSGASGAQGALGTDGTHGRHGTADDAGSDRAAAPGRSRARGPAATWQILQAVTAVTILQAAPGEARVAVAAWVALVVAAGALWLLLTDARRER